MLESTPVRRVKALAYIGKNWRRVYKHGTIVGEASSNPKTYQVRWDNGTTTWCYAFDLEEEKS